MGSHPVIFHRDTVIFLTGRPTIICSSHGEQLATSSSHCFYLLLGLLHLWQSHTKDFWSRWNNKRKWTVDVDSKNWLKKIEYLGLPRPQLAVKAGSSKAFLCSSEQPRAMEISSIASSIENQAWVMSYLITEFDSTCFKKGFSYNS